MASFKYIDTDIHYDIRGNGPDLLFMHGLGADKQQAIDSLSTISGYRIITLDMPGHGNSLLMPDSSTDKQVSFAFYSGIANALLKHLGIITVIAGGISMGAGIAMHLALSDPKLIGALLLIRPAWLDRSARPHLNVIEDIGNWLLGGGRDYAQAQLQEDPVYATALVENPACAASILGAIHRPQALKAARVLSNMVSDRPFPQMGLLGKCTIPALVVGNNADPLHPALIAREISGALGNAEYFHAPPKYLEPAAHKTAITQKIEQFLTQCHSALHA